MQIKLTHGTLLLQPRIDTLVIVFHHDAQTARAILTMKKVVPTADSANSTPFTMKHALFCSFVIIERACVAKVLSKVFLAFQTRPSFVLFILTA